MAVTVVPRVVRNEPSGITRVVFNADAALVRHIGTPGLAETRVVVALDVHQLRDLLAALVADDRENGQP